MRLMMATGLLLAGLGGPLAAQDDNPNVEARQHHMDLYSYNLSILGAMAKGERDYDAELAGAAASRLHALATLDQTGYWPEGTSSEEIDDSRALPALFENMDDYMNLTEELASAAMEMQNVAGDGAEAIGGQMRALGGSCGSCHEKYRQSDD
ncbi:cytochrome c556 [Palleronia aestuarii]|uniref:Cytochrome c556 n=1 Tax=Palleronia aestuarii TaxID=568105 RepID=A0A2W7NJ94_9RHOB|nr:cytochrome c [Palleronia aestuarii]PZX19940.1 cytochrome c556 [Palleronia aestuarii]